MSYTPQEAAAVGPQMDCIPLPEGVVLLLTLSLGPVYTNNISAYETTGKLTAKGLTSSGSAKGLLLKSISPLLYGTEKCPSL